MDIFDLTPGDRVTRAELNQRFGGGIQGGMLTPAGGKLMFLFSDPVSGEAYGYTTDGWVDERHTRYSYTGEGAIGPQSVRRGKNRILLDSLSTGRDIHLFYAVGTVPNSQTRIHEYVGQFDLDPDAPWRPETAPDQHANPRTVVVFNLIRRQGRARATEASHMEADPPQSRTEVREVPREAADDIAVERAAVDPAIAQRRERVLEDNLIDWLEGEGYRPKRLRIDVAGESGALFTDTWVPETRHLFEVKSDATRDDIRMAVAQLLDYRRHIEPRPAMCTVVVPVSPSNDLIKLVASVGLSVAQFDTDGFRYLTR